MQIAVTFRHMEAEEGAKGRLEREKWPESGKSEGRAAGTKMPSFTSENPEEITDLSGEREAGKAASRFGPEFGATVHAALSAILRGSQTDVEKVVSACAAGRGLEKHMDEAVKDVGRALDALKRMGLLAGEVVCYPEYPVVMPDGQGRLVTGYIDLVAWASDCVWIIDFKTDPAPEGPLELAYPDYVKQIGLYKELLGRTAGIKKPIRAGLLFSATGRLES